MNGTFLVSLLAVLLLAACAKGPGPNTVNQGINARVVACSAGFSSGVEGRIQAKFNESLTAGAAEVTAARQSAAAIFELLPEGDRLEAYDKYIGCLNLDSSPAEVRNLSEGQLNTQASQLQFAKNVCSGEDVNFAEAQEFFREEQTIGQSASLESVLIGAGGAIPLGVTDDPNVYEIYAGCVATIFGALSS